MNIWKPFCFDIRLLWLFLRVTIYNQHRYFLEILIIY